MSEAAISKDHRQDLAWFGWLGLGWPGWLGMSWIGWLKQYEPHAGTIDGGYVPSALGRVGVVLGRAAEGTLIRDSTFDHCSTVYLHIHKK